jgi:hypothetical protein
VTSFAYPYGSYDAATVEAVRTARFARACTSDHGPVGRGADPFALPRVAVRDWDGDEFARRLAAGFPTAAR